MKPIVVFALPLLLLQPILSAISAIAQQSPSPDLTFHTSSNLVLVDVFAIDPKNGLPDQTLKRDDFELFDNDHPVALTTFDTGKQTRPLALWFVVQCSMEGWEREGSRFFQGQINRLMPTLKHLPPQDQVAVAHWCDNGDSQLDLRPTSNIDDAAASLERVLTLKRDASPSDRPGELALQRTLQLIVDTTRSSAREPLPVVIFLYGDHSGMPREEADHFINELLETSAIAFGLKDRRSPNMWFLLGEQKEVAHYIATQTGGEYLAVAPDKYATGLEEILRQLHFRYELGFKPETLDGKRHKLTVKLAAAAKNQHKGVRLRFRAAYVPVGDGNK